jgi:hypothetical protein
LMGARDSQITAECLTLLEEAILGLDEEQELSSESRSSGGPLVPAARSRTEATSGATLLLTADTRNGHRSPAYRGVLKRRRRSPCPAERLPKFSSPSCV